MRLALIFGCAAVVAGAVLAAGCADASAVRHQAQGTISTPAVRQAASESLAPAPADAPRAEFVRADALLAIDVRSTPTLYLAPQPAGGDAMAIPSGEQAPPVADQPPSPVAKQGDAGELTALDGKTFGDILKDDLRAAPGRLWNGTKLSYFNWPNFAILSLSFGADQIIRNNLDDRVMDHMERHHTSLDQLGDTGEVLGHPALHFAAAGAWYFASVAAKDEKNHELSKVMIEALAVNGLTTALLQESVHQHDPRGDYFGWPSGHTSSSFTVASVLHEYYGWQVGVPAYVLAAYVGASRVEDRRHNLSDVWFGATLGLVVGHSVARGELPKIAGFTLLPFNRDDAAGLMLVRQW